MSLTDFVLNNNTWFEADCFDITLPNGSLLRATSHQNDLVVAGTTYYATKNGKWERGSTTQERNAVNEMELMLQCDESILFPNSVSTPMFQRAKLFARWNIGVETLLGKRMLSSHCSISSISFTALRSCVVEPRSHLPFLVA